MPVQSFYKKDKRQSDSDVWTEFRGGSERAYAHIYQANVQALFDYGMHVHADSDLVKDCIQELFIYIWQRRDSLGNVKKIQGYLMVGLRRRIIDVLNSSKKIRCLSLDRPEVAKNRILHDLNAGDNEASMRRENDLMHAIEKLPRRQKEVVYLLFYKKLSHEEIAETMSLNGASVYTLTWKAIKSLKKKLKYITTFLFPFLPCLV